MAKIKLRVDSRNKRFNVIRTFGQVVDFPLEFSIKDSQPDFIQPIGDVKCVAISCCDVASDKDDLQYDHEDLFNRIPHDSNGASPQDGLKETVRNGLLPKGQTQRIKTFNSWYEAHTGGLDAFDSVRSALMKCNYPVMVWTYWYDNWSGQEVLPKGQNSISGHAYTVEGWTVKDNQVMLIAEAWLGHKIYIPRDVFNDAVSKMGCGTAVLSTLQMDINTRRSLIEYVTDSLKNIILSFIQLLQKKVDNSIPTPPQSDIIKVVEPPKNTLNNFCLAIRDFEGKPGDLNYKNNNPGNLRSKSGPFLKFATYEEGFRALMDYVIRVRDGKHPAYPKDPTIKKFFSIYAPSSDNNNPLIYAKNVASKVGLTIDDTLSKLT